MKLFFLSLIAAVACMAQTGPCASAQSIYVDFTGTTATVQSARTGSRIKICAYSLSTATASAGDISFVSNPTGTTLYKAQGTSAIQREQVGGRIQTALGESLGIVVSVSAHWTGNVAIIMETF